MSAVRWWPGRTDEVRRVADRLRGMAPASFGDLAAATNSDVFLVADAVEMNDAVDAVVDAALSAEGSRER